MYTSMIRRLLPAFTLLFALLFAPCGFAWGQTAPPTDIHLSELQSWLQTNWFNGYHSNLGYNEARREKHTVFQQFLGSPKRKLDGWRYIKLKRFCGCWNCTLCPESVQGLEKYLRISKKRLAFYV